MRRVTLLALVLACAASYASTPAAAAAVPPPVSRVALASRFSGCFDQLARLYSPVIRYNATAARQLNANVSTKLLPHQIEGFCGAVGLVEALHVAEKAVTAAKATKGGVSAPSHKGRRLQQNTLPPTTDPDTEDGKVVGGFKIDPNYEKESRLDDMFIPHRAEYPDVTTTNMAQLWSPQVVKNVYDDKDSQNRPIFEGTWRSDTEDLALHIRRCTDMQYTLWVINTECQDKLSENKGKATTQGATGVNLVSGTVAAPMGAGTFTSTSVQLNLVWETPSQFKTCIDDVEIAKQAYEDCNRAVSNSEYIDRRINEAELQGAYENQRKTMWNQQIMMTIIKKIDAEVNKGLLDKIKSLAKTEIPKFLLTQSVPLIKDQLVDANAAIKEDLAKRFKELEDKLMAKLDALQTELTQIKLAVNAMKPSVQATKAAVDAIKTTLEANAATAAVNPAARTILTTPEALYAALRAAGLGTQGALAAQSGQNVATPSTLAGTTDVTADQAALAGFAP